MTVSGLRSPWIELGVGSLLTLLAVVTFRAGTGRAGRREDGPPGRPHAGRAAPGSRGPEVLGDETGPDGVPLSAYAG